MKNDAMIDKPLVIWRLIDGKPGHDNQTIGLVNALSKKTECRCHDIPVAGLVKPVLNMLVSIWPHGCYLPLPDLIIGAGHRTHLHLLAAQRVYGGKTIVMMQPSLPVGLFDLCLIPEHDEYQGSGDYIETRGVLNSIEPHGAHYNDQGLIMIGGPSKHFEWDEQSVLSQLRSLLDQQPNTHFQLTTSRRTPSSFIEHLVDLKLDKLRVIPFEKTTKEWVAAQLAHAATSWVTEDSVSMVYEALTAQTAVGVFSMPAKRPNRISKGINKLIEKRVLVRFDYQGQYVHSMKPAIGFLEADRCANYILSQWGDTIPAVQQQLAV